MIIMLPSVSLIKQFKEQKHQDWVPICNLRYLAVLAQLRLDRTVRCREEHHLPPLPANELPQLRAHYLSASFAKLCDATAKATIMRFLGRPHPPLALQRRSIAAQHLDPPRSSYADIMRNLPPTT